ncbi:MAG: hypothetical protein WC816_00110 [Sphingomonas sp.]
MLPVERITRRREGRCAGGPDALVADNGRTLAPLPWRPQHNDLDAIVVHAFAWERSIAQSDNP